MLKACVIRKNALDKIKNDEELKENKERKEKLLREASAELLKLKRNFEKEQAKLFLLVKEEKKWLENM